MVRRRGRRRKTSRLLSLLARISGKCLVKEKKIRNLRRRLRSRKIIKCQRDCGMQMKCQIVDQVEEELSMVSVAQTQNLVSMEEEVGAISLGLEDPVLVPQPEEAGPRDLGEDPVSVAAEAGATCLGSEEAALVVLA